MVIEETVGTGTKDISLDSIFEASGPSECQTPDRISYTIFPGTPQGTSTYTGTGQVVNGFDLVKENT